MTSSHHHRASSPSSSTSSVHDWLEQLPERETDFSLPFTASANRLEPVDVSASRKRQASCGVEQENFTSKRRALAPIAPPNMSDRRRSPRKDPQKEKEDDSLKTPRPAKKPSRATPRASQHPQAGDDDDRTPRGPPLKAPTARKVQSGPSTTLPYPQTGPSVKSTSQGQRRRIRKDASAPFSLPAKDMEALKHSSDATPSEAANFSEREPSETESSHSLTSIATITETQVIKNLMDFDQTDTPVNITGFDRYDAPPAVGQLIRDMKAIGNQRRFLHPELLCLPRVRELLDKEDVESSQATLPAGTPWLQKLKSSDPAAAEKLMETLAQIQQDASECEECDASEVEWNEDVHSAMLKVILLGHWKNNSVYYRNLTPARLKTGQHILPLTKNGIPIAPTKIDYALVVRYPEAIIRKIKRKVVGVMRPSVNVTEATRVRYSPIAIMFETKKSYNSEQRALVQLLTWATAHFNKLKQLNEGLTNDMLIPVPLVLLSGHHWRLLLVGKNADNSVTLVKEIHFGSTSSMLGMLQVAAGIERLAYWTKDVYMEWYTKHIIDVYDDA